MLKMFNQGAFEQAKLQVEPFQWALVTDTFKTSDIALSIVRDFPRDLLHLSMKDQTFEKSYRLFTETWIENNRRTPAAANLPDTWQQLIDDIASVDFRQMIAKLVSIDLSTSRLEIQTRAYEANCFMSPHTDRADKLVSINCYLETDWQLEYGGQLNILRSSNAQDVSYAVPPLFNTASLFVRSDSSWHSVAPVHSEIHRARRNILIHYWT